MIKYDKEARKRNYEQNKEKILAQQREYGKKWRPKNRLRTVEYHKKWLKENKEKEKVNRAVAEIAETEAGQIFFNWMMNTCFFTRSTIEADPHAREINPLGTVFNESRRRLYLDVRRAIPTGTLKKIEHKQ